MSPTDAPNSKPTFARKEWLQQSRFTPHSGDALLATLDKAVTKTLDAGKTPVLLLDLDSTLYDTSKRNHVILKEWLAEKKPQDPVYSALNDMQQDVRFYSMADLFGNIGLSLDDAATKAHWEDLKEYWKARFFTDPYVNYDQPYPGSPDFVRAAFQLDVVIAYLTGRDRPGMEKGTLQTLQRDGFPMPNGHNVFLYMKPQREGDDYLYKMGELEKIEKLGHVVASFENEPKNFIGICHKFPQAIHVFVDSVCSDHPALPAEDAYLLESWAIKRSRTRS